MILIIENILKVVTYCFSVNNFRCVCKLFTKHLASCGANLTHEVHLRYHQFNYSGQSHGQAKILKKTNIVSGKYVIRVSLLAPHYSVKSNSRSRGKLKKIKKVKSVSFLEVIEILVVRKTYPGHGQERL